MSCQKRNGPLKALREFSPVAGPALAAIAVARLMPHIPNFSPVGAMAIFAGAMLSRRWALALMFIGMIASDFALGFYDPLAMLFVYAGAGASALIGSVFCRKSCAFASVVAASFLGAILFFALSNFGFWLSGIQYPMTAQGLISCYVAALSFFEKTVASYLFFSMLLFGLHRALETRFFCGHEAS
ncbi:MAG: hypothetical protein PHW76_04165 [Alphaproteobacteria bacterium]|nr:hypothetical protein [Alphaproteobacteria bacterium]